MGAVYVYSLISAPAAWIYPLSSAGGTIVSPLCFTMKSVGPTFQQYYTTLRVYAAFLSVLVYVLVMLIYCLRAKHTVTALLFK